MAQNPVQQGPNWFVAALQYVKRIFSGKPAPKD